MGDSITTVLETQKYNRIRTRIGISLAILISFTIIFSGIYLFYIPKECTETENNQCFYDALQKCSKVSWIRQGTQADWEYTILGDAKGDACKVSIELKSVTEGSVDAELLLDKKMTCIVDKNLQDFPERDMSRCTGLLKEELQDLIIQKMHKYLLENIGEIKEEFNAI